jgi:diacylglycerol kinase family enzyme
MVRIALLSNPRSTGNRAILPRVRSFCANHPEIFHYEVEHVDQIGAALRTIARVEPRVLVINGGDGTVQATLTELYNMAICSRVRRRRWRCCPTARPI